MTVVLLLQFNYTLERYIVHRLVASALHAAVVAFSFMTALVVKLALMSSGVCRIKSQAGLAQHDH
jgi:hypothetical protein